MTIDPEQRPLCFIAMPFGRKADPGGGVLEFDSIYDDLIEPAVVQAGLQPIRADEERAGGIIHKPMFERLVLCEFAVADLTTANANVYYELGVRHAVRPFSTVLIFAEGTRLPFDAAPLRAHPYRVDTSGRPAFAADDADALTEQLSAAKEAMTDSPVFQLLDGLAPPDIQRLKTDVFRDVVAYSASVKENLAEARRDGAEAVRKMKHELEPIGDQQAGVVIDLFLSFRAVKAWDDMVGLVDEMSVPMARTILVQEQLALALNRAGEGERAERVLLDLLEERGPSSETLGILGRVYKDRWDAAKKSGSSVLAAGMLSKATDTYLKGFETDWRDAYPGINAATLMELADPPDPRRKEILAVVEYAARRRVEDGKPDYWDYATLLEAAILNENEPGARDAAGNALANVREVWEPETTARNLRLIRKAREQRGLSEPWLEEIEGEFAAAAGD